tara:strand:+ start:13751 stop:13993 length:243 start_codon:yes stop_codon:yes gene_type:complete
MSDELDFIKDSLSSMREDITTLKDNHLAHIEKDMNELKTTVAVIKTRLYPIEKFVDMWTQKMALIFFAAVSASVGIPMMI